jgi:restriction system protein
MVQQPDYVPNPHVPLYPTNEQARHFVRLMDGQSQRLFFSMRDNVTANIGTPQETQDWSNPDEWIPHILAGDEQALAFHLWHGSEGVINPRHLTGMWLFCSRYGLLATDQNDRLHITEAGQDFIDQPLGAAAQHIDYSEGLLNLLLIISEHGPGKRSDFVPVYSEFLERYSDYRSPRAQQSAWYYRVRNLHARELVSRSGVTYEITQAGLAYLEQVGRLLEHTGREPVTGPQTEIRRLIKAQQEDVRARMHETLAAMDPYAVEFLVKRLLIEMEYENVEVTRRSSDGGVDVVANIEVGITPVREVIQVKRRKGNIQRRVLDELRGSLYRFDATRGMIITVGGFSQGAKAVAFERGVPPITLIDGERLIDLLIEYEIGVRKRSVQLIEFEPADFTDIEGEA